MPVKTLQITISVSGTTQQFQSASLPCRNVTVQNNATNPMRVGDSAVTSSRGILLNGGSPVAGSPPAGAPGDSFGSGAYNFGACDLNELYVNGTAGDVLDVLYIV
jgi:hypothetical protein